MKLIGENEVTEEDTVVDHGTVKIAMSPKSAEYLKGATIDYEDQIVRSGFKFKNPNVTATCGARLPPLSPLPTS